MDSPFQRHLRTNYVPSQTEISDIKAILLTLQEQLDDLDSEIAELQDSQARLEEAIEGHRALLSPIRRLSPELLELIFVATLPTSHFPCISATDAPLLLTHICSSWRGIAHSSSRLWSAIHIVLPSTGLIKQVDTFAFKLARDKMICYQSLTREWLERSNKCALNVSLYESFPTEDRAQQLSFFKGSILCHSSRWRDMELRVSPELLEELTLVELPSLQKLVIHTRTPHEEFEWSRISKTLTISKSLTSLCLRALCVHPEDLLEGGYPLQGLNAYTDPIYVNTFVGPP